VPYSRNVIRIDLDDDWSLHVVRENGNQEVILSLVNNEGKVTERTKVSLTIKQAIRLARALAGITALDVETGRVKDED